MASSIPGTYDEWRHCITVDCGLTLDGAFVDRRLAALRNPKDPHTKRFTELYGEDYLTQVITWFERAGAEVAV